MLSRGQLSSTKSDHELPRKPHACYTPFVYSIRVLVPIPRETDNVGRWLKSWETCIAFPVPGLNPNWRLSWAFGEYLGNKSMNHNTLLLFSLSKNKYKHSKSQLQRNTFFIVMPFPLSFKE